MSNLSPESLPIPICIIHLLKTPQERDITPLLWHLNYLLKRFDQRDIFSIAIFKAIHGHQDFLQRGITFEHTHPVLNDFSPHLPSFKECLQLASLALKTPLDFLSFKQLGRFASHYLLWQECVRLKRPMIILEDDVLPTNDFFGKCFLSLEALHADKAQIIRLLIHSKGYCAKTSINYNFDHLFSPQGLGTHGYMLNPNGAHKLLKACPPLWALKVDTYIDSYYNHHALTFTLKSAVLLINPLDSESPPTSTDYFKGKLKWLLYLLRTCNCILKIKLFAKHYLSLFLRPS
ncbi:glycosyltransferase family 25 protein [Helicobacter suis]|uniref:glycosyltransferase family 25 protein n=1 Tax=Helicobacter suis TaxID=104628 RepID=UPI0013D36016|nr:glycosyltransferase family 25 protein [Helicobacter suis]